MKNLFKALRWVAVIILISPFILAWLPLGQGLAPANLAGTFWTQLVTSFQQLSVTLLAALAVSLLLTIIISYLSVLKPVFGKIVVSILDGVESIPAILIILFCYAPVATFLAKNPSSQAQLVSLLVFIFAATATILPEAVRSVTLPLWGLYHRKYSVSFRAYGFTKARILAILLNSRAMREVLRRTSAGILLKTMVLDCSFGFIIQIGMGAHGKPEHTSPGALIAAHRNAIFLEQSTSDPFMFWLPAILLVTISLAFLLILGTDKEQQK